MKHYLFILCSLLGFQVFSQPVQPPVLPQIWLQSETIENKQGYWQDAADARRKARTENQSGFPGASTFNYNKALSLDSAANSLAIHYPVKNLKNLTVVVVYHTRDTAEQGLWQLSDKKEVRAYLSTRRLSSGRAIQHSDTTIGIPAIHTYIPSFRKPLQDTCKFTIGATDSLPFSGKIAEFMVYDKRLNKEELIQVQTYLAIKYGVSLIKTNYTDSQEHILWDTLSDESYWHSIAGIGRDDYFGLHQKQSLSTTREDFISIGAGAIKATNLANPYEMANQDFLVWGNDNQRFIPGTAQTISGGQICERTWKIRRTGSTAHQISTVIVLDAKTMDSTARKSCHLLIDRSGNGDFTGNCEHIPASRVLSNGMIYFENVQWDTDLSGTDLFTFSFNEPMPEDTTQIAGNTKKSSGNGSSGKDTKESNNDNNNKAQINIDKQTSPAYKLFPNPGNGHYTLEIHFPEEAPARVRISDAQGKKIEEKQVQNASSYHIKGDINTQGVYLVEIESSYETHTLKLVVK